MVRRVLCCGTFDHLHPGHESFLQQAAALGDELCVVVARDENVQRIKARRPDGSETARLEAVTAVSCVDDARLGYEGSNFLRVVEDIKPDVIAIGYDQQVPSGLSDAFPSCEIVVLKPFQPDRYKSSLFRKDQCPNV